MKQRNPQLSLQLDAEPPDSAARWHEGARLPYLGGQLILKLDTDRKSAVREGEILHLPLPPAATPRQVQDGAEAWLRQEARLAISASLVAQAANGIAPRWALSFAARGSWVQTHKDGTLRFNWRLIEQPLAVIETLVAAALAALPRPDSAAELRDLLTA